MTDKVQTTPAKTRREIVLALLQQAGDKGVTTATFLRRGGGSRFGARIAELREEGYRIRSFITPQGGKRHRSNGYTYVLDGFFPTEDAR